MSPGWLSKNSSLAFTTYQAGKLFFISLNERDEMAEPGWTPSRRSTRPICARAVHWSQHLDELAQLRRAMRWILQGTTLFDGHRFTSAFEQVLRI
ncbi:MAG: hypothetical protein SGI99_17385 [Pseudomonadota bacterium]|nr:hypothetical protein [Pseudomonadota bacterium]